MNKLNRRAFLDTIAWSELGQKILDKSDDGYNVFVGSTPSNISMFNSYDDHPRKLIKVVMKKSGIIIPSTAAGRYQILAKYFDAYKKQLGLPDFGKESQDKIALQMIKECHALDLIDAGCIEDAIHACRSRWASFPGANYKQNEHQLEDLIAIYVKSGGMLA